METVGARAPDPAAVDASDGPSAPPTEPAAADQGLIGHRVTDMIRDLILSGELAPGSRISQESLAARFDFDVDGTRACVKRVFEQFLYDGGGALDYFSGCDFVGKRIGEYFDLGH